eukprot:TRINITY_DN35179_c0_g1_i1.p1 TRINITY_DN35179_c0_g1~~TRINITY_DN35179_c0_g1_i1.p1  ORF type:complete len:249 (+),score=69.43 TRINITY_DN35179_c0_g1_i1:113-859(+)
MEEVPSVFSSKAAQYGTPFLPSAGFGFAASSLGGGAFGAGLDVSTAAGGFGALGGVAAGGFGAACRRGGFEQEHASSSFAQGFSSYPSSARTFPSAAPPVNPGDGTWVTVFGFPGRAANIVQERLAALCGPIVDVKYGEGNFIHVQFSSSAAAAQCLAQNGQPLVGSLIIGCVPCSSEMAAGGGGRAPAASRAGAATLDMDAGGLLGPGGGPAAGPRAAPPVPLVAKQAQPAGGGGLLWKFLAIIFDI